MERHFSEEENKEEAFGTYIEQLERKNADLKDRVEILNDALATKGMAYDLAASAGDDLMKENKALAAERDELRAQLARCVEIIKDTSTLCGDWYSECDAYCCGDMRRLELRADELLNSLPKTAALDAEVLRCADQWEDVLTRYKRTSRPEMGALQFLHATTEAKLVRAARAAKEARGK